MTKLKKGVIKMAVKIGHAAKDERGAYKNGTAGDQTKVEVYTCNWYSRPWNYVIRFKDSNKAEKVAECMEKACTNNLIGYDQNQRNTLLTKAKKVKYDPSKVTEACETDCSALVSLCCMYAGVPESKMVISGNSLTTSTIRKKLLATGLVEVFSTKDYTASSTKLKRGDILLYEGHHVAVALSNGSAVKATTTTKQTISTNTATVTTRGSRLNQRSKANRNATIIQGIPNGSKVTYTTKGSSWTKVTYNGKTGYCSNDYLKF